MSSSSIDPYLQLFRLDPDRTSTLVAENDNVDSGNHDARVTFTVTQSSYYAIYARSVPTTSQGSYTLTIQ